MFLKKCNVIGLIDFFFPIYRNLHTISIHVHIGDIFVIVIEISDKSLTFLLKSYNFWKCDEIYIHIDCCFKPLCRAMKRKAFEIWIGK